MLTRLTSKATIFPFEKAYSYIINFERDGFFKGFYRTGQRGSHYRIKVVQTLKASKDAGFFYA